MFSIKVTDQRIYGLNFLSISSRETAIVEGLQAFNPLLITIFIVSFGLFVSYIAVRPQIARQKEFNESPNIFGNCEKCMGHCF